jgi:hypothetical protein
MLTGPNPISEKIYYSNESMHYKELHFFDEMITKINTEKEVWPGIPILDKQKEDQAFDATNLKFQPPQNSYQKEIFIGPSAHDYPIDEIEAIEKQRIYDQVHQFKASKFHLANFQTLSTYLNSSDRSSFMKKFFTPDDVEKVQAIATLTPR